MKKSILAILMSSILLLTGCGTGTVSNLVTALNVVAVSASGAEVIASALVASGTISPADAATVGVYASGVATAAQNSITELNSTDTNVVKSEYITKQFSAVIAPAFGPSTSGLITAAINVVSVAINSFLAQLNSPTTTALAKVAPSNAVQVALAKSPGDQSTLKQIQKTCVGIVAKAAVLQGK